MPESLIADQLNAAIVRLRSCGVVPAVAAALAPDAANMVAELRKIVVNEVPAFTESANPDLLPELKEHLAALVDEVIRLLRDTGPPDLGFVEAHAERRAEQKFPLDALLQAYRCTHRMLATRIRDAALETADDTAHVRRVVADVTDFTIEFAGAIGTRVTSHYVAHTRLLAEAEGDRRTTLLSTLLDGYDESDAKAARLLPSNTMSSPVASTASSASLVLSSAPASTDGEVSPSFPGSGSAQTECVARKNNMTAIRTVYAS